MAEAPRRKKLEKTVDDSTTIQTSQKFTVADAAHHTAGRRATSQ